KVPPVRASLFRAEEALELRLGGAGGGAEIHAGSASASGQAGVGPGATDDFPAAGEDGQTVRDFDESNPVTGHECAQLAGARHPGVVDVDRLPVPSDRALCP